MTETSIATTENINSISEPSSAVDARQILQSRQKLFNKTGRVVEGLSKDLLFLSPLVLSCLNIVPAAIALPVAAVSVGFHFINSEILKSENKRFATAETALDTYISDSAEGLEKDQAYVTLSKTARHIKAWEDTGNIFSTFAKYFTGFVVRTLFDKNKTMGDIVGGVVAKTLDTALPDIKEAGKLQKDLLQLKEDMALRTPYASFPTTQITPN